MAESPEHNPYASEKARQRAITARLVVLAATLAGAVGALLWVRYMG